MKVVAYLRVSTDDKGQDPGRQRDIIQGWAIREGHEVVAWVSDEGTSGDITPMQRQKVREAIQEAEEHGAEAIVVEAVDRWTRRGIKDFFGTQFLLEANHGLSLLSATTPPGLTPELQALLQSILAMGAKEYRDNLRRQIKSGLDRAKRNGWPNGRPGNPEKDHMTEVELRLVEGWMHEGHGWRELARRLSEARGAFQVADAKARRRLMVSDMWLRRELAWQRDRNPTALSRWTTQNKPPRRGSEVEVSRGHDQDGGR